MSSVQSVCSAHFTTPKLTKKKRELLGELLDQFTASVNFCTKKCVEHNVTSRASLHHVAYSEWKSRFSLATHWFHSAGQVATQTLRSWRNLCRKGQADPKKPPVYEAKTMRLELWSDKNSTGICKFQGNTVRIRVRKGEHLWLPLLVTEHHEQAYLRDWREGKLKVGEVTISLSKEGANVFVPFKREVKPKHINGVCGVDINERSVDLTILKPKEQPKHVKIDVSKLSAIRHSSQLKRKSVQKKLDAPPQRPVQKRRLQEKYWRRESNRTNQILHAVSRQVAEIVDQEQVAVAFEDIKGIRGSMRSKQKSANGKALRKDMRRRLNQWPFHKLQFYVDYKTTQRGLPTVEVSNYRKSKNCPICGRYNRPNGHAYHCLGCGFEAGRHLVASWNIAKDGASHVPADCWQMQRAAEEELVAQEKLPAEPEKIPMQQFATGF
nr:transposase [Candidatus Freyarchaeota archaeon]